MQVALYSKILKSIKINKWYKLVAITGGGQVLIQCINFLVGIVIIRILPTNEYAYYIIANNLLGGVILLSDSGISTSVMSQGGKTWENKDKLGAVIATGFNLRRKLGIATVLLYLPVLIYLLRHNEAELSTIILLCVVIIPSFNASITESLLEIAPKLHQLVFKLQINQIGVSLARLMMSIGILVILPTAYGCIIASTLPRYLGNEQLKVINKRLYTDQKSDEKIENEILKVVKKIIPNSIYSSLSNQVTILLISIFGRTISVAELGAIGRISMLLNIFLVLFNTLVNPHFARLQNNNKLIFKYLVKINLLLFFFIIMVVVMTFFLSDYILQILGSKYLELSSELLLSMTSSAIYICTQAIFVLYSIKSWILNPIYTILINIACLIIGIKLFDVSTIQGVLLINLLTSSTLYASCVAFSIFLYFKYFK